MNLMSSIILTSTEIKKEKSSSNTISSIMNVFDIPVRVLFYSGSSQSFVSFSFALYADRELTPLKHKLVVMTPLGEQIIHTFMFRGCEISIEGIILKVNLIPLEM